MKIPKAPAIGRGCHATVVVGLWLLAAASAFLGLFFWRTGLLTDEFDRRVHVGLTRADVEHYLGPPSETVRSRDRLPDEPRIGLPAREITGSVSAYGPVRQPRWHGIPFTGFVWWIGVWIYYDEQGIVEHVHSWNCL